jgi:hypothetical protein
VGFVQFLPEKRLFLFMNSLKDRAIDWVNSGVQCGKIESDQKDSDNWGAKA